jgi:5-methyltetrahydrofolate--homocysteine methyltransferase
MTFHLLAVLHGCRYLSLSQAQSKIMQVNWSDPINKPVRPAVLGTEVFKSYPIEEVVDYIDWNPFFQVNLHHTITAITAADLPCQRPS